MKTAEEIVFPRVEFPNYLSKANCSVLNHVHKKALNVLSGYSFTFVLCVCE